jgi:chitin disaccharide deacetylase
MKDQLAQSGGRFPGKFSMLGGVVTRRISPDAVEEEWRAQIQRCVDRGVRPRFLNSHEHVHMLPPLFGIAARLATEFGIRHLRFVRPEWRFQTGLPGWFRNLALAVMSAACNGRFGHYGAVRFLGIGVSGKLNIDYFRAALPRLEPGKTYELMCHPGYFDPNEIRDPALLSYHAWEQELSALRSPEFRELCRSHGVQLIGYRDLPS